MGGVQRPPPHRAPGAVGRRRACGSRSRGDPGDQEAEVFVPRLAVNAAVALAVLNVAVLICFIHHISDSIQVSTLATGVRSDLLRTIDRLYATDIGRGRQRDGEAAGTELPAEVKVHGARVTCAGCGHVQSIRDDDLMAAARLDDDGALRVHAPAVEVGQLIGSVVDSMRWYAASAPGVMHATLETLEDVGAHARTPQLRAELASHVDLLEAAFTDAGHQRHDLAQLTERAATVRRSLRGPASG